MGTIDIDGDRLCRFLVTSVKMNQRKLSESEKGGDWYGAEMAMAARASVLSVLQLAIRERDQKETDSARRIVEDGECEMAWNTSAPEWWNALNACCARQYGYHIMYGEGEDAFLLCPTGRGYWQLARILLTDAPQLLRTIAQRTSKRGAPRWVHWAWARRRIFDEVVTNNPNM